MIILFIWFYLLSIILFFCREEIKPLIYNDKGEINEQAFETLTGLDGAKVQRLKSEAALKFDNGYNKGKSESFTDAEKMLKETFGVNDDLPYPELLLKIKESIFTIYDIPIKN